MTIRAATLRCTRRAWLGSIAAGAAVTAFRGASAADAESPAQVDGLGAADEERVRGIALTFLEKYRVPGISWAIARRGKLAATGGFGWANTAEKMPVNPTHLFRIASVSKPITSIAVMKLIEEGSIALSHRVFAGDGRLRKYFDSSTNDPVNRGRLEAITVQHLLEHTAGGWGNARNDPMFVRAARGLSHPELIRWTLRNASLENTPGEKYAYSNFGYCLLGRVIESLTDSTYFEAVQRTVLEPAGVSHMRIGQRSGDAPSEVRYYGQGSDPYGEAMDVARMDAHGGWIARASDLVRIAVHADGFPNPADLLSKATLTIMTKPSSANDHYAKGWMVNESDNWWHMGWFAGGSSILVRTHDGYCWALLVNGDSREDRYRGDLDQLGWDLRKAIHEWPSHDRFGS